MPENGPATLILQELAEGDSSAADRLLPLVYDELRALAGSYMKHERVNHTLQPTALVHEAYMRLVNEQQVDWNGKSHFCAIAARCIRQILINHAHAHRAVKRGSGAKRITLYEHDTPAPDDTGVDLLDLDELLTELSNLDERQSKVVELRFFGGLSVEQTATVLEVSPRTVESDWSFARAWLKTRLAGKHQ